MNKAIYAGSFDPFTIGHWDILSMASKLFDEVHLVFAINSQKTRTYDANEQVAAIKDYCIQHRVNNVVITTTNQLLVDYAKQNEIIHFVRGVRGPEDYNYELNIANINKMLYPECQTIFFQSNFANISSSFVKEMIAYNKDINNYVIEPIADIVNKKKKEYQQLENLLTTFNDIFTHH